MRVSITTPTSYQDAGVERRLELGQVADLPDIVAAGLLASGVAEELPAMDGPVEAKDLRPAPPRAGRGYETKQKP